jgi:hypothetical protein
MILASISIENEGNGFIDRSTTVCSSKGNILNYNSRQTP